MADRKDEGLTRKQFIVFRVLVPMVMIITISTFIIGGIIGNLAMILISGGISVVVTCLGFAAAFLDIANNLRK